MNFRKINLVLFSAFTLLFSSVGLGSQDAFGGGCSPDVVSISFDQAVYAAGETASITATTSSAPSSYYFNVASTSDPGGTQLLISETAPGSQTFEFQLDLSTGGSLILLNEGDTLTVSDFCDEFPGFLSESVFISPVPPNEVLDQENLPDLTGGSRSIATLYDLQLGQQFMQDGSELSSVQIFFYQSSGSPYAAVPTRVCIFESDQADYKYDNAPIGCVTEYVGQGPTEVDEDPVLGGIQKSHKFEFNPALSVTPGTTYVLNVEEDPSSTTDSYMTWRYGNNYNPGASSPDETWIDSGAFTIQTTDLNFRTFTKDITPPEVESAEVTGENEVTIVYDEPVIATVPLCDYTGLIVDDEGKGIVTVTDTLSDTHIITFITFEGGSPVGPDAVGTIDINFGCETVEDAAGNDLPTQIDFPLTDGQASEPDTDGDGIPDSTDQCITEPETINGYLDEDGCPDVAPPGTLIVLEEVINDDGGDAVPTIPSDQIQVDLVTVGTDITGCNFTLDNPIGNPLDLVPLSSLTCTLTGDVGQILQSATIADTDFDAGTPYLITFGTPTDVSLVYGVIAVAEADRYILTLAPGLYSVVDPALEGYSQSLSADCSGSIASGETKTCTVTNDDIAPTITLNKIVDNGDGALEDALAFDLTYDEGAGAQIAPQGVAVDVTANVPITIDEDGPEGYVGSISGDPECPLALDGAMTLDEGDNVTCTITNDDVPPTLVVGSVSNARFDHPEIDVSGTVFGYHPGAVTEETVSLVVNQGDGDEVTLASGLVLTGNPVDGGTWSASDLELGSSYIGTNNIRAVLSNPTSATSPPVNFDILPHQTSFEFVNPLLPATFPDTLFDDNMALEVILVDDEPGTADTGDLSLAAKSITVTGSAVSGTQLFSTDPGLAPDNTEVSTGPENIIASGHGTVGSNLGGVVINADLSSDPLYLPPVAQEFDVVILPHTLEFIVESTTPAILTNSVPFDNEFDMNLRVVDVSAQTISNPSTGILDDEARTIEITGSGVATSITITSQNVDTLASPDVSASPTDIQTGDVKVQAAGFSAVSVTLPDDLRDIMINSAELDALDQYLGPAEITTEIKIDPHGITVDTQPCDEGDEDVKWDHITCLETTVTDNNFIGDGSTTPNVIFDTGNLGDSAAHEICYSGLGVAGENVQCFPLTPDVGGVASTGDQSVQAGTADDAGLNKAVVTTFDLDNLVNEYGNSPVTNAVPFSLNLNAHQLTLPLEPMVNIVEETGFAASGIMNDQDIVLSDEDFGVGFNLVNFDTGNPSFAQTSAATLTQQSIPFSGQTGGTQQLGTAITGGITVTDSDASFFNTGNGLMVLGMTVGGVIEFPPGSASVAMDIRNLDLDDTVTMSVTSESGSSFEVVAVGVDQNPYPNWSNGATYEEGDTVVFSDRFYKSKINGNTGNTPPTTTIPPILDENSNWKEILVTKDFTNFVATVSDGVSRIEITDVRENDLPVDISVDISEIRISDPRGEPQIFLKLNFDEIDDLNPALLYLRGPTNTNTFSPGSFHAVAIATAGPSVNNQVSASFTPPLGENAYTSASATPQEYDVIEATWGFGGQSIAIVPDSGTGFTGITCGVDQDFDGLCDGQETNDAISINSGFTTTGSVPVPQGFLFPASDAVLQPSPGALQADVYLEIDVMAPLANRLDQNALRDVQLAFKNMPRESPKIDGAETCVTNSAECGIFLHAFIDEEVPQVDQLEVWQDFDTIKDDFAAYKSQHFGSPTARAHLDRVLGAQTVSFVQTATAVLADIDNDGQIDDLVDKWDWIVTGIYLETPEDNSFTNTRGRIIVEEQVVFGSPTIAKIEGTKSWTPASGVSQTVFKNLAGSMKNSIGQDTTTPYSFIFRAESTFDATDTNLINEDGVNTGTTKVRFMVPTGTNVLGATHTQWRISPDVVTTVDDARAQFYHYVLVVDSIGPCGPSGIAEFLGNDMIISLGCGFGNVMTVSDPNPDPNNDNKAPTVGSRAEQANTIMHELGHNFKLNHGGPEEELISGVDIPDSNINCKPNYDSTMSYTQQSTVWVTGTYNKPHFSQGQMASIDETILPNENFGLGTTSTESPGRKIVFANGLGAVVVDRVTPPGGTIDKINWNGDGDNTDTAPGAVDVNSIPGLTGCEASPGELLVDHDDVNNIQLIFGGGGLAFDGVSACATCIPDHTSVSQEVAVESLDWYDGLLKHNQLSPPNYNIFNQEIIQEVEKGQNMDVSFQMFNCNPNNKFDETTGVKLPGDLCIDTNMVVKKAGFYSTPVDGKFQNFRETLPGLPGEETLVAITGQTFEITIQRVLPLGSPDQTTSVPITYAPFDQHSDGNTIWYHSDIDTDNLPTGQYKAIIKQLTSSEPRELYDYNKKIFNPLTGNFVPASLTEVVPSGSLTGNDDEGNSVSFLFNIVEADND